MGQTKADAFVPAFGLPAVGSTEVMFTAIVVLFTIGQAPSFTLNSTFTGLWVMSPVQQTVIVIGFVPVTETVEPGSRAAAWEVIASTSPGSGS